MNEIFCPYCGDIVIRDKKQDLCQNPNCRTCFDGVMLGRIDEVGIRNSSPWMGVKYYVRGFKQGKWQPIDVEKMGELEFRRFICWKIGMVGMNLRVEQEGEE